MSDRERIDSKHLEVLNPQIPKIQKLQKIKPRIQKYPVETWTHVSCWLRRREGSPDFEGLSRSSKRSKIQEGRNFLTEKVIGEKKGDRGTQRGTKP